MRVPAADGRPADQAWLAVWVPPTSRLAARILW
jgi:hypothetical protein